MSASLAGEPVVEARELRKTWRRRLVLDGLDLQVRRGERVSIRGENGAGKTTLLRILCGLVRADSGTARITGFQLPLDWQSARRSIGYLPAGNSGMYARLSVLQHLELWARLGYVAPPLRQERIEWAIDVLQLSDIAFHRADRISTGQRQRTRIASILICRPTVILMDEPTLSLDESGKHAFEKAIEDCVRSGSTFLACLPTGASEDWVSDRQLMLAQGKLSSDAKKTRVAHTSPAGEIRSIGPPTV